MKCPLNSRHTRERVAYESLPSVASLAARSVSFAFTQSSFFNSNSPSIDNALGHLSFTFKASLTYRKEGQIVNLYNL